MYCGKQCLKKMQELIPDLQVADTVNDYDKLIFKLVYGNEQYELSDVSEGTVKGLILNMLINMPMDTPRTLLAIDEPETNLHPAWQKVVGNWIQTTDTFRQCFISTHSPDFLDVFTEEFRQGKVAMFAFGSNETIKEYHDAIVAEVHSKLESDIPVFILYASPEVESWFITDWNNGFGYLYGKSNRIKDMDQKAKSFFLHHLRDYIYSEVLKEYSHNIEEYGWFENGYVKLSDQIISVIQTNIKDYVRTLPQANSDCVKQIIESRDLYYSKKLHGDIMLRSIRPDVVAEKCRQYFMGTYNELAYFGDNNV